MKNIEVDVLVLRNYEPETRQAEIERWREAGNDPGGSARLERVVQLAAMFSCFAHYRCYPDPRRLTNASKLILKASTS